MNFPNQNRQILPNIKESLCNKSNGQQYLFMNIQAQFLYIVKENMVFLTPCQQQNKIKQGDYMRLWKLL